MRRLITAALAAATLMGSMGVATTALAAGDRGQGYDRSHHGSYQRCDNRRDHRWDRCDDQRDHRWNRRHDRRDHRWDRHHDRRDHRWDRRHHRRDRDDRHDGHWGDHRR
jgi:hypothetical protein